jgi:hypothetical protein
MKVFSLKLSAFLLALAGCCGLAFAAPASEQTSNAVLGITHSTNALPAALRTAVQGAIATDSPIGSLLAWLQEQKVTASDGVVEDEFGWAVAIDGDTAFIGAATCMCVGSSPEGKVYVFTNTGGTWVETQKLTADVAPVNSGFGWSIALEGSTALIGAPREGRAYVFTKSGGTWTQTQKFGPSDDASSFFFGAEVALDLVGTTAIVGSPFASAAYVFDTSGSTWIETQKLLPSEGPSGDEFGNTLALDGSTLLVGAFGANVGGITEQGAAYIFEKSAGTWAQTQKLTGSDSAAGDWFGTSTALVGTTAFVGAIRADTVPPFVNQGAAYVFDKSGGTWTQTQKLVVSVPGGGGGFGQSIALEGTTAVISAMNAVLINGSYFMGAAYVFTNSGGSWSETQQLVASDGTQNDFFGWGFNSVALQGGTVLVGAYNATIGANGQQGAAYFYGADTIFQDGFDGTP